MTKVEAAEVTRWLLVVMLVIALDLLLPQLHLTENSYTMGMYHGGVITTRLTYDSLACRLLIG